MLLIKKLIKKLMQRAKYLDIRKLIANFAALNSAQTRRSAANVLSIRLMGACFGVH